MAADSLTAAAADMTAKVDSAAADTVLTVNTARPPRRYARTDSLGNPVSSIRREKVDLDNTVTFSSQDSMILLGRSEAIMYGDATVDYGDLKLDAAEIRLNLANSEVYACGREDSLGDMVGEPVFEQGGSSYESKTMRYNFKSERGYITDVITQQGEGYLTGGRTKKTEGEDYFLQDGVYTTCDNHENPHFYLQLTRAKVRPGKNIVTGPAYMVLAGLPLPLAVPFGYFPFSDKYASGVIVPTFGDDYNRGFYLSDGGYYFAINDNIDLA
ncbi:MAG: LPS-assembly protein LptD, partial [Muribaculaceae bacterium]|nr:LPS-assembly protein LptD [Muribaculaceae bacterium]